jgi:metal-responsive CopG/Arc/MetJ family transcriptional regulator
VTTKRKAKLSTSAKTIRRSVVLPIELLEQVQAHATADLKSNVNKLVTVALKEYLETRKRKQFEQSMAQMAADPQIRKASQEISSEFIAAELDGLENPGWE